MHGVYELAETHEIDCAVCTEEAETGVVVRGVTAGEGRVGIVFTVDAVVEEVGVGPVLVNGFAETLSFMWAEETPVGGVESPAELGVELYPFFCYFGILNHSNDQVYCYGWHFSGVYHAMERGIASNFGPQWLPHCTWLAAESKFD